jgi:alkanesulfonate monooxygenase SsuD/methylene tetrahydromethanopterin reductase-like flavin-dependent oxidoreductase (luciferase family)
MVASQSYRNPALHANIASSLDHISSGRVYFGIGAGWKEVEYEAYGIPFPKPMTRIKQLEEAVKIAKLMWSESVAKYEGEYYSVNTVSMPKPVQNSIPVVIGGMGYQLLKVSARQADMINFAWNIPLNTFKEKLGTLRKHCETYDRNYNEIRVSAGLHLALKDAEALEPAPYEKYTGEREWEYRTPEDAAEFIRGYKDLGVTHFVIVFPYGAEERSIEVLMNRVADLV